MTTVSRLDGWPICSPADASLTSSRTPAHGSGPMWVATPSSQWTFTTYSLPVSRRTHSSCGPHTRAVTLYVTSYTEGFSHFVTSMTAPVASGWSFAGWGLHPLESAAFSRRTRKADKADRRHEHRKWEDVDLFELGYGS